MALRHVYVNDICRDLTRTQTDAFASDTKNPLQNISRDTAIGIRMHEERIASPHLDIDGNCESRRSDDDPDTGLRDVRVIEIFLVVMVFTRVQLVGHTRGDA